MSMGAPTGPPSRPGAAPPSSAAQMNTAPPSRSRVPRWLRTRTAVGVICGLIGLLIGSVGSGDDVEKAESQARQLNTQVAELEETNETLESEVAAAPDDDEIEALIEDAVDEAVTEAVDEAVDEAEAVAAEAQQRAVAKATAKVRAQEQRKADARVAEAKSFAVPPASAPAPASGTDPRFDTCGDANAAGYGPYRSGSDPEYDWYDDRDDDGLVCES